MITASQLIKQLEACDPSHPVVLCFACGHDDAVVEIDDFTVDDGELDGTPTIVIEES